MTGQVSSHSGAVLHVDLDMFFGFPIKYTKRRNVERPVLVAFSQGSGGERMNSGWDCLAWVQVRLCYLPVSCGKILDAFCASVSLLKESHAISTYFIERL